jgi:hypothetical protein
LLDRRVGSDDDDLTGHDFPDLHGCSLSGLPCNRG